MIDDTMAERMVACGWIAATVAGLFMLAFSFMLGIGFAWLNFAGGAIILALAYGVYRRSRICAVLVLINHFLGVAALFTRARYIPPAEIAVTSLLAVLYVLGVIGTFAHHARRRPSAA